MERFIFLYNAACNGMTAALKSNMERFIYCHHNKACCHQFFKIQYGEIYIGNILVHLCLFPNLKSNMERFIFIRKIEMTQIAEGFKIQYGEIYIYKF